MSSVHCGLQPCKPAKCQGKTGSPCWAAVQRVGQRMSRIKKEPAHPKAHPAPFPCKSSKFHRKKGKVRKSARPPKTESNNRYY